MIDLVALDLDGTLIGDDLVVSPRVRRAIQAVQDRDVTVTLATGRMHAFAVPFAHELHLTAPLISYQGALICPADSDAPLYRVTMSRDLMREALDWQIERGWQVVLFANGAAYVADRRRPQEFYRELVGEHSIWVDDLRDVLVDYDPMKFIVFVKPDTGAQIEAELRDRFGDRIAVTRSHALIVEGNPLNVSKGDALRWLAGYLGVHQSAVMAIGDQDNDAPMLSWAGLGVAMGNGSAATRDVADWVAPALDDDGVAVALERFVLNTPPG
ncbi:MAG: HAD family phosphatase [Chloroflexi bacterium]|nr:HAD family phosphatase [Chloroflexota bacterium]